MMEPSGIVILAKIDGTHSLLTELGYRTGRHHCSTDPCSVLISQGGKPAVANVVAAPILKLCAQYRVGL